MSISVTLLDYFRVDGFDCRPSVSPEIVANGVETVDRVNQLLDRYVRYALVNYHATPVTHITSGYRTPVKNKSIPNAAPNSKHMSAQACDLYDPDGLLDDYCLHHQDVLAEIGIWLEHPACTRGWSHQQIVAPRSGRRTFYP